MWIIMDHIINKNVTVVWLQVFYNVIQSNYKYLHFGIQITYNQLLPSCVCVCVC